MFVGLSLNIARVRLQRAWEISQGVGMANSNDPLPAEVFDAIAPDPETAAEMEFEVNAERELAKVYQEYGFQP